MSFALHSDPAHGYLYVSSRNLARAGLRHEDFTTCSFISPAGGMYLEEDCDLGKFATEWEKRVGKFEMTIVHVDCPAACRALPFNSAGQWEPFGPIKGEVKVA